MQIVIDISDKDYQLMKDGHIPFSILDKMRNGTPLPKWLNSFNTESAAKCFEAIQILKNSIEYKGDN